MDRNEPLKASKQSDYGASNLIPINKRSKEEAAYISSLGGLGNKNNSKSILGARIREIKKRGMTEARKVRLYEIMTNPDISVLDIREKLEDLKDHLDAKDLIKSFIDIHKLQHGTKVRSENLNINININDTIESAYEKRIKEIKK